MARDMNHVTLIGRLVRDPEIRYTASGTPVTKFSIANNNTFLQSNEKVEYVNYFDINVWGNQAINCDKYLKKGSQIAIIGSIRQNRWTDKATGQTRSKIEITANAVQFLTPVGEGSHKVIHESTSQKEEGEDPWQEEQIHQEELQYPEEESDNPFSDDIPF